MVNVHLTHLRYNIIFLNTGCRNLSFVWFIFKKSSGVKSSVMAFNLPEADVPLNVRAHNMQPLKCKVLLLQFFDIDSTLHGIKYHSII